MLSQCCNNISLCLKFSGLVDCHVGSKTSNVKMILGELIQCFIGQQRPQKAQIMLPDTTLFLVQIAQVGGVWPKMAGKSSSEAISCLGQSLFSCISPPNVFFNSRHMILSLKNLFMGTNAGKRKLCEMGLRAPKCHVNLAQSLCLAFSKTQSIL